MLNKQLSTDDCFLKLCKEGGVMNDNMMTQEERLQYLLEEFKRDSTHYKDLAVPERINDQQSLLRALMNVRMPKKISNEVLSVQDDYLIECTQQKGIVKIKDIPVIKDNQSIWQGDITRLEVDAIVNAANAQMLGCFIPMHTCIDNQIHTFAGIQLREECHAHMTAFRSMYGHDYEQPTAIPLLTEAYNLPAKKVIHVVGPIVTHQLTKKLEQDLADCYTNILDLCEENGLRSVAFCCISTGVFHFPNQKAAQIAVKTVDAWVKKHPEAMDRIIFNVFKEEDKNYYEELFQ